MLMDAGVELWQTDFHVDVDLQVKEGRKD